VYKSTNISKALIIISVIGFILVGAVFSIPSFAQIIDRTKDAFGLPRAVEEQKENLSLPDSMIIVPLKMNIDEFVSTKDWYEGLYYYQTFRLNQGDFLFHYVVTKEGEVLQGNTKGEEQRFAVKGTDRKPVLIAYLSEKDEDDFSPEGRKALNELIVDVANRNRIKLETVEVKNIEYQVTEQQQIVAATDIIAGRWERSLKDMVKEVNALYDPSKFKFDLHVTAVKTTDQKVKIGQEVVADITIKNNSSISLYQGSDFEPIMTKVQDGFSKFFVNKVWLGPKQTSIMSEGSSIKPGESKTFKVKLGVPLYFDKQTENFELVNKLGEKYADTKFELTLDIEKTEIDVIEIASTPVGYLNVREDANSSSKVVTKVSPGQRFLVVERKDSGWVQIDAGENGKGWISTQYTKKI
jgi:hypothetical protein